MNDMNDMSVVERERAWHNELFGREEENRVNQYKYYFAISKGQRLFDQRLQALSRGATVLEYGCGSSPKLSEISGGALAGTGIDISDVAIAHKNASAEANVQYHVMNAEEMTFDNGAFDLVFGSGIIHHLDIEKSLAEISRVLRPGGTALFWEPLGHNILINGYRKATPGARTPDEHPLLKGDFDVARKHFKSVTLSFYGLATLASVPLRNTVVGKLALNGLSAVDAVLFGLGLKWQAWYVLMEMTKLG